MIGFAAPPTRPLGSPGPSLAYLHAYPSLARLHAYGEKSRRTNQDSCSRPYRFGISVRKYAIACFAAVSGSG